MSRQISNLTQQQQMSPLLDSRSDDSLTAVKVAAVGCLESGGQFPAEGPSVDVSFRLGSEQSPPPSESYRYCVIPDSPRSQLNSASRLANVPRSRYQNDSSPVNSGPKPAKHRPVPRPPPRSVSESEVDNSRHVPPRTYLNNNSVGSPLSRIRNHFTTDCTNEIGSRSHGGPNPSTGSGRQRLWVILAILAICLALCLAGTAAFFSIHTYLTTRDSKQEVQVQATEQPNKLGFPPNVSLASAHVGLMVKDLTAKDTKTISNYTLYLTDDKSRLHYNNVKIWDRGLTIQMKGMYFVYSSIVFNINENVLNCDLLDHKTWLHHVILSRGYDRSIPLLRSEHTCCTGCPEYHTSGFTGGVFELLPGDNIYVRVSAPVLVFDDKESSFLGLFLVK